MARKRLTLKGENTMTPYEFVVMAIEAGKAKAKAAGKDYKGLHTVFSNFNEEYRAIFGQPGMDKDALKALPIAAMKKLAEEKKIQMHPAFKGVMIYIYGEMPDIKPKTTRESVMAKYGLTPPPVIAPPARAKKSDKVHSATA
jgi:hypothetical protein